MDKTKVGTLVIMRLESHKAPVQARDLYDGLRMDHPALFRKGFKSFVQVLNDMPRVQPTYPINKAIRFYVVAQSLNTNKDRR